jgi:hypothetical protein
MRLHDFGLWFLGWTNGRWSNTIPQESNFDIFYDGKALGYQDEFFTLKIYDYYRRYIITVKGDFPEGPFSTYQIGRILTPDDFEIVENPDYQEIK